MSHPPLNSAPPHAASLVDTSKLSSTPRSRNRGNHLTREIGEYDDTANKERVKDIEKAVKGELMGSVILDIDGLVENVFPPILFERLRGEHGPICLEKDPKHPDHFEVPLEKPRADSKGTAGGTGPSDNVPAKNTPAPDDPSKSVPGCSKNKPSGPQIPKPPPCPIIDDIFEKLSETTGTGPGSQRLYNNDKWLHWPNTDLKGMEGKVSAYLNKIVKRARRCLHDEEQGNSPWTFTAHFSTNEMKLDQVSRKPDLVLIPDGCYQSASWQSTRSVGEIRSSRYESERKLAEGRLAQYSRLMFGDNYARRFNLVFSLVKDDMTLFRYDRAGVLGSTRFNVHEDPKNFLRVILGLALGEDYFLGLDPSFFKIDGKNFVKLNDKEYEILETLHLQSVTRGRGTVALRVIVDAEKKTEGVIKDQWVDKSRDRQEFSWLLHLESHGAKNVARLLDHQLVRFRIGDVVENDVTSGIRELVSARLDGLEAREHRRVLVTPAGKLVKHFRSLRELVSVFKDFAEGILSAYRADVFHRDISRRNLVIDRQEGSSIGKGCVIDFDCAAFRDHTREAVAELTGTVPFMAISILANNGCAHKFYYELESLFYTLIWTVLMADEQKEDGHPLPTTDFTDSELFLWCGPQVDDPKKEERVFKQIANNKSAVLANRNMFAAGILSQLSPYFHPIRRMLEKLRDLLFRPVMPEGITLAPQFTRVQDREDEENVFETFIGILDDTLKELEKGHADQVNDPQPLVNEPHANVIVGKTPLVDVERVANRRRRELRAHDNPTVEEELENENHGSSDSDGGADDVPDSPTPLPAKGPRHVDSLTLDRQSRNLASSGSRTAVSRAASPSMSAVSKAAISLKTVSIADRGDISDSGGFGKRSIVPDTGSRDTSSAHRKRAALEPEQSHSSSKRRRC